MRHIDKTEPPEEFIEYCKTPGVCYDDLSGEPKRALRKRLLEDQGYICCYCGCRIENDEHTIIEHIQCQDRYGELALNYKNMLVSCDGGENDRAQRVRPRHNSHCASKKDNGDIPISPLNEGIENLLTYFEDGSVKGTGIGKDLIRILGLDVPFLNANRKNAILSYEDSIPADLEAEIGRLQKRQDGKYDEYCFVLEQYLRSVMLERAELMGV